MAPSHETVDTTDQLGSVVLLGLAVAGGAVATVIFILIGQAPSRRGGLRIGHAGCGARLPCGADSSGLVQPKAASGLMRSSASAEGRPCSSS